MLEIRYIGKFEKDMAKCHKRGLDMAKLIWVIDQLAHEIPLPTRCAEHLLTGNWKDCSECHVAPDWLLIFRRIDGELRLIRTGTHADLFG